jgi:hypothetical protein
MNESNNDDELRLRDVSRDLPTLDIEPATAERIARAARGGRPMYRVVEVVLVVLLAVGVLGWAVVKLLEAFR